MGDAIPKITSIAEIVRHRVLGLYQVNTIDSQVFEDIYEPLEEGLDRLVFTRLVPSLTVKLTKIKPTEEFY